MADAVLGDAREQALGAYFAAKDDRLKADRDRKRKSRQEESPAATATRQANDRNRKKQRRDNDGQESPELRNECFAQNQDRWAIQKQMRDDYDLIIRPSSRLFRPSGRRRPPPIHPLFRLFPRFRRAPEKTSLRVRSLGVQSHSRIEAASGSISERTQVTNHSSVLIATKPSLNRVTATNTNIHVSTRYFECF